MSTKLVAISIIIGVIITIITAIAIINMNNTVSWSFEIPQVENVTFVTVHIYWSTFKEEYTLPVTINGTVTKGSTIELDVYYFKEQEDFNGTNIKLAPELVTCKEYKFTVTDEGQ